MTENAGKRHIAVIDTMRPISSTRAPAREAEAAPNVKLTRYIAPKTGPLSLRELTLTVMYSPAGCVP